MAALEPQAGTKRASLLSLLEVQDVAEGTIAVVAEPTSDIAGRNAEAGTHGRSSDIALEARPLARIRVRVQRVHHVESARPSRAQTCITEIRRAIGLCIAGIGGLSRRRGETETWTELFDLRRADAWRVLEVIAVIRIQEAQLRAGVEARFGPEQNVVAPAVGVAHCAIALQVLVVRQQSRAAIGPGVCSTEEHACLIRRKASIRA